MIERSDAGKEVRLSHLDRLSEVRLERFPIVEGKELTPEQLRVSKHRVLRFPIHDGSEDIFPVIESIL